MDESLPQRVRLVVAYDGSPFAGFAANAGVRTVGGDLADALERVLGQPVRLTVAGRTDKGVHASAQVCTFDIPPTANPVRLEPSRLMRSLNGICGPSIAVREVTMAPTGFDARFSATWRRYEYTVWNDPRPDPRWANWSWHVGERLDLDAMNQAAVALIGEHDFASFCRRPPVRAGGAPGSTVRRVLDASWLDLGDGRLVFDVRASAFCHQMVRSLTAFLVEVGRGRRRAGDVLAVLRTRDRSAAAGVAPPQGLCLVEVGYPAGDDVQV